jgi:hypothetical protein
VKSGMNVINVRLGRNGRKTSNCTRKKQNMS